MSDSITLVPAVLFKAVATALDDLGFSSEGTVDRAGLPPWQYGAPHTLVPGRHFYRLVSRATREVGSEEFGSLATKNTPITALDQFGERIGRSITVYDAIRTMNTLYPQMSSIDLFWAVEDDDGLWWLRERRQPADRDGRLQMELGALCYMTQVVRLGIDSHWTPNEICLEGDSHPGLRRLAKFGNAMIYEEHRVSGIRVPRRLFASRIGPGHSSAQTARDSRLFRDAPCNDFLSSMRQVVQAYVAHGQPRVEEIAQVAGLHVRTLQRRLKSDGTSFKRVVDQARFVLAGDLLQGTHMKLVDVAGELGYSDQANFNRAFRRWAGVSPSEYRSHLLTC